MNNHLIVSRHLAAEPGSAWVVVAMAVAVGVVCFLAA